MITRLMSSGVLDWCSVSRNKTKSFSNCTISVVLVVGLRFSLIIPTCRTNLVLQVIWQCDIFGITPAFIVKTTGLKSRRSCLLCSITDSEHTREIMTSSAQSEIHNVSQLCQSGLRQDHRQRAQKSIKHHTVL